MTPSSSASATSSADPPKEPEIDAATAEARALYASGIALSKSMQWSDALEAFERSFTLKAHPVTAFNIGYCQRALGRYLAAGRSFRRALAENDQSEGRPLPPSTIAEIHTYLDEIAKLVVHLIVRVKPAVALVALDGLPLSVAPGTTAAEDGLPHAVADGGVALDVDPGPHVLRITMRGFADVVVNRSMAPGSSVELPIDLDQLPSKLHVDADVTGAFVKIDGRDVGMAPIDTERPAGEHRIEVEKDGYVSYSTTVTLEPGGRADMSTKMLEEHVSLTKRWWFWGGAATIVAGGVLATYLLTRPTPGPPPYDGGKLGWVVP